MGDTELVKLPAKVIIAGKPGQGKTTLVTRLIYDNFRKFKYIVAFCPSLRFQTRDYECLTNPKLRVEDASAVNVKKYIDFQEHLARKYNRKEIRDPPHALFIFDDILDSNLKLMGKDKQQFVGMLSTCRHCYASSVFILQTLHNAIPPGIRDQVDLMYLFHVGVDGKVLKNMINTNIKIGNKTMTAHDYENQVADLEAYLHHCLIYRNATDKVKGVYNKKFKCTPAPPFKIEYVIEGLDSDSDESFF